MQSALRLFRQQGYHATTMQDIADDVGVLKGSLYYHINNKEQLLLELLTTSIEDVLDAATKAAHGGGSARERLRRLVKAEVLSMVEHQSEIVVWQTERRRMQPALAEIDAKARMADDRLRQILRDGGTSGEWPSNHLDIAYQAIRGMIVWFAAWYHTDGDLDAGHVADRFADYAESIVTS